jgi:hypothetical protein
MALLDEIAYVENVQKEYTRARYLPDRVMVLYEGLQVIARASKVLGDGMRREIAPLSVFLEHKKATRCKVCCDRGNVSYARPLGVIMLCGNMS